MDAASPPLPLARGAEGDAPEPGPGPSPRPRFIEPLRIPRDGLWTRVGLGRTQFFGLLVVGLAVFMTWGGPLWQEIAGSHASRIVVSYGLLPVGALAAQLFNRTFSWRRWLEASVLLACLKFFVSVVLLIAVAFAT